MAGGVGSQVEERVVNDYLRKNDTYQKKQQSVAGQTT